MFPLTAHPRTITPGDFPRDGTSKEQWLFLINYALLAPSEYNTQPWLFRVEGKTIELLQDHTRRLPVVDPEERELLMSCGAALENLRLAARHFGFQVGVESCLMHEPENLLACLTLGEHEVATPEEDQLFAAIPMRHTNRMTFEEREIPPELLSVLQDEAGREGTWLQLIQDESLRMAVARLVVSGDRDQWANKDWRTELAEWVQPRGTEHVDGLPGSAQPRGSFHSMTNPFVVRTFDLWREESERDRLLTAGAPVLAVLGTFTDTRSDWFAAGRALERVLLRATASGLQMSFINQPIEIPSLRVWLGHLLRHTNCSQLVLRLGYGSPNITSPRRCVRDVLLVGHN